MQGTIQSLHVYPVKSATGFELDSATINYSGFELDRRWMLINENNRFVSQRQISQMALLTVSVSDDQLCVNYPGQPPLHISIEQSGRGEKIQATMHRADELIEVIAAEDSASAWFTETLKDQLRLVRISPQFSRRIPDLPDSETNGVELADGYPYLIASTASLAKLNDLLIEIDPCTTPLEMNRFRPNIVIDIDEPWSEMDEGLALRSLDGAIEFQLAKTCQRCGIPQVNPTTGETDTGAELHKALKDLCSARGNKSNDFGQNAIPTKGIGKCLKVGMKIEITR